MIKQKMSKISLKNGAGSGSGSGRKKGRDGRIEKKKKRDLRTPIVDPQRYSERI